MKVAVIGAGNVGTALATSMIRAGHEVTIASRDPAHARAAAEGSGARPSESSSAAVRDADVVVLAIPYVAAGEAVAAEIAPLVDGKTLIDATNPIWPDMSGIATVGTSAAEEFQRRLPTAKVVKAFNTLFASRQADPKGGIDGFVAADDGDAKRQVLSLVESMGFTPLDVGPLSSARYLEAMAFLNITLNMSNGWDWTSAWKLERSRDADHAP